MRCFIAGFEEILHQVVLGVVRRKLVVCVSKEGAADIFVRRGISYSEELNAERCYRTLAF